MLLPSPGLQLVPINCASKMPAAKKGISNSVKTEVLLAALQAKKPCGNKDCRGFALGIREAAGYGAARLRGGI